MSSQPFSIVTSQEAPAAVGHYSHAIRHGQTLYLSGQIGLDPQTMQLVSQTDVQLQAEQVMKNIKSVLESAGSSLNQVLKVTILLTDIAHFQQVNTVYAKYFGDHKPARACYAVHQLPLNSLVEIECIAHCDVPCKL